MDEPTLDLVARYRQGDEQAAHELFARYVERLTTLVRCHLHPRFRRRFDPEDAVHSAYRSFFVRAQRGEFVLTESGALWKLLVTLTLNKLREKVGFHLAQKRSVLRENVGFLVDRIAHGPSPLEAWLAAEELSVFMTKLTPLQRQVLELRLQETTWPEIAVATQRSERTGRRVLQEVRTLWEQACLGTALASLPLPQSASPEPTYTLAPKQPEVAPHLALEPVPTFDYRDFVLQVMLGAGGMGKVYRALHKATGATFALKMLRKSRWQLPAALERFLLEARLVRSLTHPHIVKMHGLGRTPGGGCFLVMDYHDSENLEHYCQLQAPSERAVLGWMRESADALCHAHARNIIHCDLKPSNLLLDRSGQLALTDFGLAISHTLPGSVHSWGGTLGYMAPEQLDPLLGTVSPATDIFAWGVLFHKLLTGRLLFHEQSVLAVLAQLNNPARLLSEDAISEPIKDLLSRCLHLHASARPTARAVLDSLADLCANSDSDKPLLT